MTARVPIDRNRKARLGSASQPSSDRVQDSWCSTSSAPVVCRVTVEPGATSTRRPSSASSSPARSAATRSTAPSRTAWSAVTARPLRTVSTAKVVLRPRWAATASAKAAASLSTLSEISPPWRSTGVAAPMVVPGAIAATWAEKVMIAPAEAARAPEGVTYTTTGTRAFRNAWLISRIEESSPPGVSSSTRKAACPSRWAARTPPASWSATTGVIGPATRVTSTVGACPTAAGAQASSQPNPRSATASSQRTDRSWYGRAALAGWTLNGGTVTSLLADRRRDRRRGVGPGPGATLRPPRTRGSGRRACRSAGPTVVAGGCAPGACPHGGYAASPPVRQPGQPLTNPQAASCRGPATSTVHANDDRQTGTPTWHSPCWDGVAAARQPPDPWLADSGPGR